jgi:hypothetical protein
MNELVAVLRAIDGSMVVVGILQLFTHNVERLESPAPCASGPSLYCNCSEKRNRRHESLVVPLQPLAGSMRVMESLRFSTHIIRKVLHLNPMSLERLSATITAQKKSQLDVHMLVVLLQLLA